MFMDFLPQLKELAKLQGQDRKVQIPITISPEALKFLDKKAADNLLSRGDLLLSCLLRIFNEKGTPVVQEKQKSGAQICREEKDKEKKERNEFNRRVAIRMANGTFYDSSLPTIAEEMRLEKEAGGLKFTDPLCVPNMPTQKEIRKRIEETDRKCREIGEI